ncbi:hypothetical protein Ahy_A06g029457 [Arachis hypogaea]|uniref:Uncharacterized protein n=1 Tax=Arachis hypogaea TaxID=3818 RepID=A0A445CTF3_ARAHY|nr:hypothetical protein Ahy_A06g029457 [Arachis hypogaea]
MRIVVKLSMLLEIVRIKTFMNDHKCPRETKNRLANKKWLACKLVKKLRKYPNLKHFDIAQCFKTKYDFHLNKFSLIRALGDTRAIVYGNTAAQYGIMVRDYGLILLKNNLDSTVTVGVIPQPNPDDDLIFEKMYNCLDGYKRGFKAQHGIQVLSAIG